MKTCPSRLFGGCGWGSTRVGQNSRWEVHDPFRPRFCWASVLEIAWAFVCSFLLKCKCPGPAPRETDVLAEFWGFWKQLLN